MGPPMYRKTVLCVEDGHGACRTHVHLIKVIISDMFTIMTWNKHLMCTYILDHACMGCKRVSCWMNESIYNNKANNLKKIIYIALCHVQ